MLAHRRAVTSTKETGAHPITGTYGLESGRVKLRLEYLDGLRGLAALYVVLFHCYAEFIWRGDGGGLSPWMLGLTAWMGFGHHAVVVFIVLSGYCLMLPVVRSGENRLPGGVWAYLKRRASRTLPAYYGAIALSLVLIAAAPGLRQRAGAQWDRCLPAFTPDVLLSHLLLLHNMRLEWHQTIDAPLWSMATEWDIYFVFALLLLPLWRRLGTLSAVGLATILGLLPHLLLPAGSNLDWACPWFLGAFAMGMAGAVIGFSTEAKESRWRITVRWERPATLFGLSVVAVYLIAPYWGATHWDEVDHLVAAATACLLVILTRHAMSSEKRLAALRLLEHPWVVTLGSFSYSLYLIHFPLLALVHIPLRRCGLLPDGQFLVLTALAVPISISAAYLFHRVFERPFLLRREHAAALPSPAPVGKEGNVHAPAVHSVERATFPVSLPSPGPPLDADSVGSR